MRLFFVCLAMLFSFPFSAMAADSPEPKIVAEATFKVSALGGTEDFYFGFCKGDQIVFNFEEVQGKELKEIEILEYPSSSLFMDYKTSKVEGKLLNIVKTGIYKFRFYNSAAAGRICKYKITRIPSSEETRDFNTSVYWRVVNDTSYYTEQEKYLARRELKEVMAKEVVSQISSQTAINGNSNRVLVQFSLPQNTIAWSYYIGVGEAGKQEYYAAKNRLMTSASKYLDSIPGYGPLAALALEGINVFSQVMGADNVKYYFISDAANVLLFQRGQGFMQYKQGDVINDAQRMNTKQYGECYIGLVNDNVIEPITVHVKIVAVTRTDQYATRNVQKYKVASYKVPYLKN